MAHSLFNKKEYIIKMWAKLSEGFMKSKFLKIARIVLGVLILMLLLTGPILTRLGVEAYFHLW